jgi:hypothetical protein
LLKTGVKLIYQAKNKLSDYLNIWDFIKRNVHPDFYLTSDNKRVFITEGSTFKQLMKESNCIFYSKEKSDIDGVIMLWSGKGDTVKRNYIKINAKNNNIADRLLTILLWNTGKDLYVKIKKYSPHLQVFKDKNFQFVGGRGKEMLLVHKKRERYVNNFKYTRNKSS